MAEFSVRDICSATGGRIQQCEENYFTGVSTDTRTIKPGNLFVAITGERFDGHSFINQAIQNGASGIIVSTQISAINSDITVIVVEDTLKAYQDIAAFHRNRFSIPVIAITGSNGKTTTKDFTAAVLSSRWNVLKTQANYNNEIGLPLTLLHLEPCHDVAVVEMGMRGLGEIHELTEIARPTIAILTNVGETHIELLGSLDNIATAKSELVSAIPKDGFVVLNADNDHVRNMSTKSLGRVVYYGIQHEQCQVRAVNVRTHELETVFDCEHSQGVFTAVIPALGKHNVYNALAAITTALALGLHSDEIKAGLRTFTPSAMRLAVEKIGNYNIINDAYNASPMSMAAAIDTLVEFAPGRRIAVLGDMLELGSMAVKAHQEIGQKLAAAGVDIVVTVGELAQNIAVSAQEHGITTVKACGSHAHAQRYLQELLKPGDTVLLKGSRGMKMEKILEELI